MDKLPQSPVEATLPPIIPVFVGEVPKPIHTADMVMITPPIAETAPTTLVESANEPALTSVGLPVRERLKVGAKPVTGEELSARYKNDASAGNQDPYRAALIIHVSGLDVSALEAFASGNLSLVPDDLLNGVSYETINEVRARAGKQAETLRQTSHPKPLGDRQPSVATYLNGLKAGAAKAKEALRAGSTIPLPTRTPMELLKRSIEEDRIAFEAYRKAARYGAGAGRIDRADMFLAPGSVYNDEPRVTNKPKTAPKDSDGGNGNDETQILPWLHRDETRTVKFPINEAKVAVNGLTTMGSEKRDKPSRFSLKAVVAAGVAVVAQLVKARPAGRHRRASRPSFALNN